MNGTYCRSGWIEYICNLDILRMWCASNNRERYHGPFKILKSNHSHLDTIMQHPNCIFFPATLLYNI